MMEHVFQLQWEYLLANVLHYIQVPISRFIIIAIDLTFVKKKCLGIYCQTLINPCMSNPCQLNGICQETLTGFECICLPEYQDTFCQTHVNPCLSNPCVTSNTISCEISDKSMKNFICMCHPDYVGR